MVDISVSPGVGFMQIVEKRDAETLLPIILAHTRPGTTIHSDQRAAYSNLQRCLPTVAVHRTVNHGRHFVDLAKGTHTQSIESYRSQVKAELKCMRGTTDEMLGGHLDEYLWRERYGRGINRRFDPKVTYESLITDIATQYPH
jgi:hypothetical protein